MLLIRRYAAVSRTFKLLTLKLGGPAVKNADDQMPAQTMPKLFDHNYMFQQLGGIVGNVIKVKIYQPFVLSRGGSTRRIVLCSFLETKLVQRCALTSVPSNVVTM